MAKWEEITYIYIYLLCTHLWKINSIPSVTNSDLFLTAAGSNYTDQTAPMVTHPPSPTQDPLAETYGKDCDLLKKWLTRFKRREKKEEKNTLELRIWSQCMGVLDVIWKVFASKHPILA